jgi:hypothetical protein
MTPHTHDDPDRLTIGCLGCIERRQRAQFLESLTRADDDTLAELMAGVDHFDESHWQRQAIVAELATRRRGAA